LRHNLALPNKPELIRQPCPAQSYIAAANPNAQKGVMHLELSFLEFSGTLDATTERPRRNIPQHGA
jgi:hypothetical protein